MLKNTKLLGMLTSMMAYVGMTETPIVDGKVSFEEEAEKNSKKLSLRKPLMKPLKPSIKT